MTPVTLDADNSQVYAPGMDASATLGSHVKTERNRMGLSQREFAPLVGISQQHLSSIERGVNHPAWEVLVRLEAAGVRVHIPLRREAGTWT